MEQLLFLYATPQNTRIGRVTLRIFESSSMIVKHIVIRNVIRRNSFIFTYFFIIRFNKFQLIVKTCLFELNIVNATTMMKYK